MPEAPIGDFKFPGVNAIISGTFDHVVGARPSLCSISTVPQYAPSKQVGDLALTFGSTRITFKDCAVVRGSFRYNQGGQIIGMTIQDRRWKWAYTVIDGHYNRRNTDGKVIESTKKSARELVEMLFREAKEKGFEISNVPSNVYPEVKWVAANVAEELDSLCRSLSLRIAPQLNDRFKIYKIGQGKKLPTDNVIDGGVTLNSVAAPDSIEFVGERILYEYPFELEAVALDTDDKVRLLGDISYRLDRQDRKYGGFQDEDHLTGRYDEVYSLVLESTRDEEFAARCRTLAQRTVYSWYRIKIPSGGIKFKGRKQFSGNEDVLKSPDEILDILDVRAGTMDIKRFSKEFPRPLPAKVIGTYFGDDLEPVNLDANDPNVHHDYVGEFTIDPDNLLVQFSNKVFRWEPRWSRLPGRSDLKTEMLPLPAKLWLVTAVQLQSADGREDRLRIEKARTGQKYGTGPLVIREDSVSLSVVTEFKHQVPSKSQRRKTPPPVSDIKLTRVRHNYSAASDEAKIYINNQMQRYQNVVGEEKRYPGFRRIELDGAIVHVQWVKERRGPALTLAARNSELNTPMPTEEQRSRYLRDKHDEREAPAKIARYEQSRKRRVN